MAMIAANTGAQPAGFYLLVFLFLVVCFSTCLPLLLGTKSLAPSLKPPSVAGLPGSPGAAFNVPGTPGLPGTPVAGTPLGRLGSEYAASSSADELAEDDEFLAHESIFR